MNTPNAINPTTGERIYVGVHEKLPADFVWVWEYDTEDWLRLSIDLYARIAALESQLAERDARLKEAEHNEQVAKDFHSQIMVMFAVKNPNPDFTEANKIWQKFNRR